MKMKLVLAWAVLSIAAVAGGPAFANICQADDGTTCATGMPINGYCQCTSRGATKDGTVVRVAEPRRTKQMSHPDCQAMPGAPGCPHQ